MTALNERHDLAMKIEALLLRPGVRAMFEQQIGIFKDWCAEWEKDDAKWCEDHADLFQNRSGVYDPNLPTWEPSPWDRLHSVATRDPDRRLDPLTVDLYGVKPDPPLNDEGRRLCLSWVDLPILHDLALQDDARVAPLATALDQDQVHLTQDEMIDKWASWKPVMDNDFKVVEAALQARQAVPGQAGDKAGLMEWAGAERVTLAIVFTDIVGSTALRNKIGDQPMDTMVRVHFDQGRSLIRQYQGHEVKTTGDGFIAVFHSTDEALAFAMALHLSPGDPSIQMRAGIHVGEVTVERDQDIDGQDVNFTSRVIAKIEGAEIWLSDSAKQNIDKLASDRHRHLTWERREEVNMKGFEGSFTLWKLVAPHASSSPTIV